MNGPTGLIFAMRSRYTNQSGTEAFFNEADTAFSGQNDGGDLTQGDYTAATDGAAVGFGTAAQKTNAAGTNPALLHWYRCFPTRLQRRSGYANWRR